MIRTSSYYSKSIHSYYKIYGCGSYDKSLCNKFPFVLNSISGKRIESGKVWKITIKLNELSKVDTLINDRGL